MPYLLQFAVLGTIVLCVMVIVYTCVPALIQCAFYWPRRGYLQDPPPPAVERPEPLQLRGAAPEELAWGDGNPQRQPPRRLPHEALENPGVHRRVRNRPEEEPRPRALVEDLGHEEDETDSEEEFEELSEMEDAHSPISASGDGHSRPDSDPERSNLETQTASTKSERRSKERSPRTHDLTVKEAGFGTKGELTAHPDYT
ncbi:hypothetical protein AAFF_G00228770 [Aldrovandia affinis]|uniref:Uncharacterized protein n=1 Tax=Aldrovandia affinis TaxID=143900 RepID=A0AAD7SX63_9TELE|nr:hypothetical protein AAFF_G00228770 [Aldrovandia affinis]